MSPETRANIALWRQKAIEGTLTVEEMRDAIRILREDRVAAASSAPAAKRKKAAAVIPDADTLLAELGDI